MYDIRRERGRLEAARLGVPSKACSIRGVVKREANEAAKVGTETSRGRKKRSGIGP